MTMRYIVLPLTDGWMVQDVTKSAGEDWWIASFASREHAERFADELNSKEREPTSKQRRLSEKPSE